MASRPSSRKPRSSSTKRHARPRSHTPKSERQRNYMEGMGCGVAEIVTVGLATTSAHIIHRYDPRHKKDLPSIQQPPDGTPIQILVLGISKLRNLCETIFREKTSSQVLAEEAKKNSSLRNLLIGRISSLRIPEYISKPPPLLFLGAGVTFALAISFYRYLYRNDKYQNHILGIGMSLGLALTTWQSDDFWMDIKGYLAWAIVLALILSSLGHWASRCIMRLKDIDGDAEDGGGGDVRLKKGREKR